MRICVVDCNNSSNCLLISKGDGTGFPWSGQTISQRILTSQSFLVSFCDRKKETKHVLGHKRSGFIQKVEESLPIESKSGCKAAAAAVASTRWIVESYGRMTGDLQTRMICTCAISNCATISSLAPLSVISMLISETGHNSHLATAPSLL